MPRALCTTRPVTQLQASAPGSNETQKILRAACREILTGSVSTVNATRMGRTTTEEKHNG